MEKKFISTYVKDKKGSHAEALVWEAVKSTFFNHECIAYLNYPIFSGDFSSRKEPDILIIDKKLGAIIIEVKGITIGNIVAVQGHKWTFRDFYTEYGNPYQQAEQQMYALSDRMQENVDDFNKISKRVLVSLPYITKAEWEERGFHLLPNVPPIAFKDDIENEQLMDVIKSTYLTKSDALIKESDWQRIVHLISGEDNSQAVQPNDDIKYSYLYIASTMEQLSNDIPFMEALLEKGKKVIVLAPFAKKRAMFNENFFAKYEENYLFQFYKSAQPYVIDEPLIIKDGTDVDEQLDQQWFSKFPTFNKGQYKIEHAPIDANLAITAGAGTGKTTVMMQRILYLLAMNKNLHLKDIVMISFTRDSAQEMKKRLKDELLLRYNVTGQVKYLEFAEELREMNISTIHSYSKTLIQELGFVLGFGKNVKLKSYKVKRKEIIGDILNEYVGSNSIKNVGLEEFRHYELINILESFWDKMEQNGLTKGQIDSLSWGKCSTEEEEKINQLFKYIFPRCEEELERVKNNENAITIGDLIRKISEISIEKAQTLKELSAKVKYLFIDEFQDSDDVQIKIAAQMNKVLGTRLLVVGDIKQSIYRFRGADYTAFKQLSGQVNERFIDEPLQINYRTSKSLLSSLDEYFNAWGKDDRLIYKNRDQLIGNEKSTFGKNEFKLVEYNKWSNELEDKVISEIKKAQQLIRSQKPESKKKRIALLVRTNNQAKVVQNWCETHKFVTQVNVGGTFFNSEAVKDFYSLIGGLLFSNHAKSVLNALATPYFHTEVLLDDLVKFEGENDKIISYLKEKHHLEGSLLNYVKELRIKPVFSVLRMFITKDFLQTLYSKKLSLISGTVSDSEKVQLRHEVKQYQKNINHLMNILHQNFDSTNATLYSIYSWLGTNIKTNRLEDEPQLESTSADVIEIVTVHKSKGLEYHTVIIPFTDQIFDFERDEILFDDQRKEVGWFIKKNTYRNNNYFDLEDLESEEIVKEETRLLYVATTRARERIVIFTPTKPLDQTWSMLLDDVPREGA